jgi:hypothetical protein
MPPCSGRECSTGNTRRAARVAISARPFAPTHGGAPTCPALPRVPQRPARGLLASAPSRSPRASPEDRPASVAMLRHEPFHAMAPAPPARLQTMATVGLRTSDRISEPSRGMSLARRQSRIIVLLYPSPGRRSAWPLFRSPLSLFLCLIRQAHGRNNAVLGQGRRDFQALGEDRA